MLQAMYGCVAICLPLCDSLKIEKSIPEIIAEADPVIRVKYVDELILEEYKSDHKTDADQNHEDEPSDQNCPGEALLAPVLSAKGKGKKENKTDYRYAGQNKIPKYENWNFYWSAYIVFGNKRYRCQKPQHI